MLRNKKYRLYSGDKEIGSFSLLSNQDKYRIILFDNLDLLDVPIDYYLKYKEGRRRFTGNEVFDWIKDRVIPPGRQNINEVLEQVGIEEYDELAIFLYAKGKFVSDRFWIEEIN